MSQDWITAPEVLDIICSAGLPVGSEVKLDCEAAARIDITDVYQGERAVVLKTPPTAVDSIGTRYKHGDHINGDYPEDIIVGYVECSSGSRWWVCRPTIIAWKPPKEEVNG